MTSVIGQAIIEVVGDAKKFPASVEEGVKPGLAAAEAETSASGTKMGSSLKGKFSSAFSGVGQVAKIAIGVGVAEAFKTGFEKVQGDQIAMARLEAGIKSTGDTAGITAKQGEELAGSIQNYSGQSKESIINTEQLLLRFKNLSDTAGKGNQIFTETTKIAADMAARMGGDASSQATKLGKALNDPIKGVSALARVGVTFTDAQKAQITAMVNSGNTMGAQKLILAQLTTQYGGSAQAVGKTLPGQINIAKLSFEDLAGKIVSSLIPVFHILLSVVGVLTPVIAGLAPILGPLAIAIFAVVGAVKAWTAVQEALDAVLEANPIVLVISVLAVLVVAVIAAYKHSQTFRDIVQAAFHVVEVAVGSLLAVVKTMIGVFVSVITTIVDFVKKHWELLVGILLGPIGIVIGLLIKHWNTIVTDVKNFVNDVINFFRDHWKLIIAILTGPVGLVVLFIVNHWNQISSTARTVVNDVIGFFGRLVGFITGMPGKIASAAVGMWDGIKTAFRDVINWIIRGWNSLQFKLPSFKGLKVAGHTIIPGFEGPTLGVPQIPQLATGGLFDGLAIAGEFGPELIAGSGRVHSRSDTQKMLGGVTIHPGAIQVVINGHADADVMHRATNDMLDRMALMLRGRGVTA